MCRIPTERLSSGVRRLVPPAAKCALEFICRCATDEGSVCIRVADVTEYLLASFLSLFKCRQLLCDFPSLSFLKCGMVALVPFVLEFLVVVSDDGVNIVQSCPACGHELGKT